MIYAVPFGGGGQKSKHILPVHHRPLTSADRRRNSPRVKIPPGKSWKSHGYRLGRGGFGLWLFLRRLDNGEE